MILHYYNANDVFTVTDCRRYEALSEECHSCFGFCGITFIIMKYWTQNCVFHKAVKIVLSRRELKAKPKQKKHPKNQPEKKPPPNHQTTE